MTCRSRLLALALVTSGIVSLARADDTPADPRAALANNTEAAVGKINPTKMSATDGVAAIKSLDKWAANLTAATKSVNQDIAAGNGDPQTNALLAIRLQQVQNEVATERATVAAQTGQTSGLAGALGQVTTPLLPAGSQGV